MALSIPAFGGGLLGKLNATAATVWYGVIPGAAGGLPRLTHLQVVAGNTDNTLVLMRPIGRANTTQAQTTSDSSVTLDADPSPTGNTIAAADQVVIAHSDGTYRRAQVNTSGWNSTSKVLTFNTTLAAAVASGAKVWMFGVPADTDPVTGVAFPVIDTPVNATTTYDFKDGFVGAQFGDPLMVYCVNATNATNCNYVGYSYSKY